MFELVIFDLDGVLVDSEGISCDVLIAELARHGYDVDQAQIFQHYLGRSFATMAEGVAVRCGRPLPDGFEASYRASLHARFGTDLRKVAGVGEVLDALTVPFCIATSSSPERAARSIAAAGLDRWNARVFTASMVTNGKPAPDLFLHVAREMNAAPQRCLVVEDSAAGIEAAKSAGMTAWRFTGGAHFTRGYGEAPLTVPADRDFARMPDFFTAAPGLRRK